MSLAGLRVERAIARKSSHHRSGPSGPSPTRATGSRLDARRGLPRGDAVSVVCAERPGLLLGERVAVALAVGGAHERRDDLDRPLLDPERFAPEVAEPEVDE